MSRIPRVAIIFGTRPEAIKLSPLVLAMRRCSRLEAVVCVTAQHRGMLDQVLAAFDIIPSIDLDLMRPDQALAELSASVLTGVDGFLGRASPDLVVVQGDTTTAFCASLAAFYRKLPVAHVEAGLRTGNVFAPFPEEMNRVLVSRTATYHFAPTEGAASNLLREGIDPARVWVTGNTVVDALRIALEKSRLVRPEISGVPEILVESDTPLVLITGHRRENFGEKLRSICEAVELLARRFPDVIFVYPVHRNPNVFGPVHTMLAGLPNISLIEPLGYLSFVRLMDRATLILTDSGGIQEEAPSLRKPVLVMRDTTERREVIDAGLAKLVGTDRDRIVESVACLIQDRCERERMTKGENPYGDGYAAERILSECERILAPGSSR